MGVSHTEKPNAFSWKLMTSSVITVKSLYSDLMNGLNRFLRKYLCKLKAPLKIKIFMLFLHRRVLLTKDNLARRCCTGCKKNVFFVTLMNQLSTYLYLALFSTYLEIDSFYV